MKTYLKIFLATAISFAIFMGIFYAFRSEITFEGIVGALIEGIFYGVSMSLILGFLHRWSVTRITSDTSDAAMRVHQVRNIELKLPYDRAFTLCIRSLDLLKKSQIKQEDRSQGKITAKTGMTWKTFGNVVLFELFTIDNERTQIKVSSKPFVPTTLVDYGENYQTIETIVDFIQKKDAMTVE